LTFTPDQIKKSFELIGLHPYNLDAITPAMMAPSRATSSHAPIHTNESSLIKRLKEVLSDVLEHNVPVLPPLPLMTPHTPVAASLPPESDYQDHQDIYMMASGSSGPVLNAGGILAKTHAHWIVLTNPITNANCFKFFATPPDTCDNITPFSIFISVILICSALLRRLGSALPINVFLLSSAACI
jgi:hypothetical protein